jgi:hypothetical protein
MDFDVADFLQSLFAPVRIVAAPEPGPTPVAIAVDQLGLQAPMPELVATLDVIPAPAEPDALPTAGWVRRQDHRGRWGWEAPDLPDWQAWWRRFDYDDLPRPPDDLFMDDPAEPTRQDQPGGHAADWADTLDLQAERAVQGHLLGAGGA